MSLYHWSEKPNALDLPFLKEQKSDDFKPRGLWVDSDYDWPRWCISEQFSLGRLAYCRSVTIVAPERVLFMPDNDDLNSFTERYLRPSEDAYRSCRAIDWSRVAEDWDGIVITPYQWHHRMELMWYYGWDCASGCIWNGRVIEVREPEPIDIEWLNKQVEDRERTA